MCAEDGSVLPDFQLRELTPFLEEIWLEMDAPSRQAMCEDWADGDLERRASRDVDIGVSRNVDAEALSAAAEAQIVIANAKCGSELSE
jgi:hypothetical protein